MSSNAPIQIVIHGPLLVLDRVDSTLEQQLVDALREELSREVVIFSARAPVCAASTDAESHAPPFWLDRWIQAGCRAYLRWRDESRRAQLVKGREA